MSKVFFITDQSKIIDLWKAAGFDKLISNSDRVALKIHFGEPGNTAYLQPAQVKPIAERIKSLGGKPFFTDANTLYEGPRKHTQDHLKVARDHGFTEERAGGEAIISEENDYETISVNLKHFKKVFIAQAAAQASVLIALTHFKGHELTGFGGALKNVGMGLGNRLGKLRMHQDCEHCPEAKICKKNQTIESCWVGSPALVQEKMVEYVWGATRSKKCGYINFLTKVSPNCDCYPFNDTPIVPDIGVLASNDPVSLDQACADLVNRTEGRIKSPDKWRALYPTVDWTVQLTYAEKIGLGTKIYELIGL